MERNKIHQEISKLIEKISYLNQSISDGIDIHSVELDLLKAYADELKKLINQLEHSELDEKQETMDHLTIEVSTLNDELPEVELKEEEKIEVKPDTSLEPLLDEAEKPVEDNEVVEDAIEPIEEMTEEVGENQVFFDLRSTNDETSVISEEETTATAEEEVQIKEPVAMDDEETVEPVNITSDEPTESPIMEPSINDRFAKEEKEIHQKISVGQTNFKDAFDLSEKFLFTQELFDGNMDAFETYVRKLNHCEDVDGAKALIEEQIKPRFNWESKKTTSKKFLTVIERHFTN